jgi:GDPmannose 4,6-dehydratase
MLKKALISGITGQDGSYLAELLLSKGYKVFGLSRNEVQKDHFRLKNIFSKIKVIKIDYFYLTDLKNIIQEINPDEFYHLAAFTAPADSHLNEQEVINGNQTIYLNILSALETNKKCKLFNASTAHIFSINVSNPVTIDSEIDPVSPYGIYKAFNYKFGKNLRETEKKFIVNGVLFNHESPRRRDQFVTSKITSFAKSLKEGKSEILFIGNMDVERDWGHAKDYVEGMWLSLQQEAAKDYLFCTGVSHTVRCFIELSLKLIGISIIWKGEAGTVNEYGINEKTSEKIVQVMPEFFRQNDYKVLKGDTERTFKLIGWKAKTTFEELVQEMIES